MCRESGCYEDFQGKGNMLRHCVSKHREQCTEEEIEKYEDKTSVKVPCPECDKKFCRRNLEDHLINKHGKKN